MPGRSRGQCVLGSHADSAALKGRLSARAGALDMPDRRNVTTLRNWPPFATVRTVADLALIAVDRRRRPQ
jgi:hypothetical protein